MNYVQALWRGVETDRSEGVPPHESSHPYFGRLVHYERFDGAAHWEATLSHPGTGARFTLVMPGDRDTPIQPFANFHRAHFGHPDAFLRRCADELRSAFERHTGRALTESYRGTFELQILTLPAAADPRGVWSASFYAAVIDAYFEVRFVGDRPQVCRALDVA
ncbi:MAG: hypothetical protein H6831_00395 [Planctomycetes bacterium]|nr:hypothetical protein [Planctomycetota bacterium]MCB9902845.1 hypothetical protein [Planctomycetota bacterium]